MKLLTVLVIAGLATDRPGVRAAEAPPNGGSAPRAATSPPLRDPTRPSPALRELLGAAPAKVAAPELPPMELKARIVRQGAPAALLLIDGRLHMVRPEDTVPLPSSHGGCVSVRVLAVTPDGVQVEVLPQKVTQLLN
jgi:hypothetical protein